MEGKRNKISIEQANPFTGFDNVVNSISDIKTICTNIEFKSEAGLIVSLPNNETSLLADFTPEELLKFDTGSSIDVHYDPDGIVCKYNDQYDIYKNIILKTNSGAAIRGSPQRMSIRLCTESNAPIRPMPIPAPFSVLRR